MLGHKDKWGGFSVSGGHAAAVRVMQKTGQTEKGSNGACKDGRGFREEEMSIRPWGVTETAGRRAPSPGNRMSCTHTNTHGGVKALAGLGWGWPVLERGLGRNKEGDFAWRSSGQRICLIMQGTQVWSWSGNQDPTRCRATKLECTNYRSPRALAHAPQKVHATLRRILSTTAKARDSQRKKSRYFKKKENKAGKCRQGLECHSALFTLSCKQIEATDF